MAVTRRQIRTLVTDFRIWGVTCLLFGWPALGVLLQINAVVELATPIVYVYLLALSAIVRDFPGFYPFWAGLALSCFGAATVLVSAYDRVRKVVLSRWKRERESTVND